MFENQYTLLVDKIMCS